MVELKQLGSKLVNGNTVQLETCQYVGGGQCEKQVLAQPLHQLWQHPVRAHHLISAVIVRCDTEMLKTETALV